MGPSSVQRQVAEIAAMPDRPAAYAQLLHLQRGCADEPSDAADLAAELPSTFLPLLLRDAAAGDEAIATSALKCLGFALYHPVLVSTISVQMALLVLDTLVQVVMNTRMKSVCNLGVWCISVQQLEPFVIDDKADPVLIAIVHALDNPFGSLSTTFEAAQAMVKLAGQSPERMRDLSSLWVPPMYRRLLSSDKTERDMAERFLNKVSCIILPPQPLLSKTLASDLEQKLLSCMRNMLDDPSKKVQAVKSWGWSISLLGPDAVNNRLLINKLLKVPERMFIDQNPQVQVATMVSWRNLVDAFFPSQAAEVMAQQTLISPLEPNEQARSHVKRIRLIMVPLCQVLSRSRNIVLSSFCLSTWNYLLHRLGNLINYLPILEASFGPILKIIFSFGINDQNKPLWLFCMNLFHGFVSSKNRDREDLCTPVYQNFLGQSCTHIKALLDVQHIKWLPWDISCFHFQLDILGTILNRELFQDMIPEMTLIVMDCATEIFRFLLQGIQIESRQQHAYEQVNRCINNVCKFVKKLLDHIGEDSVNKCAMLLEFGFRFVKVIVEELDHSLLTSENIEVCLDIEHIKEIQHAECSPKVTLPRIRALSYMEMVSPAVNVTALSLSMVARYNGELSHRDAEKLALIMFSSDTLEIFHVAVSFMYMQIRCLTYNKQRVKWMVVWNTFAKHLNRKMISYLETSSGLSYHNVLHQFFCYPFLTHLYPRGIPILWNAENSSEPGVPVPQDQAIESTIEVYRSLSTNFCNSKFASEVFFEGFYEYMVRTIDENMALFLVNFEHSSEKIENAAVLSALGEVVIGLLQNDQMLTYANQKLKETGEDSSVHIQPKLFLTCFELANRFMWLSSFSFKANPSGMHQVTNRVFSTLSNFIGRLVLKKDILLVFEIIGDQLNEWLSLTANLHSKMQHGEIIHQLEKLWLEMVECLKRSQLISDGPICQKQQLLQVALSHPHHPISVATASVCRAATHGNALLHSGFISKSDEISMHRRKGLNGFRKRTIASNSTELMAERNGGSVNALVGLRKKRLNIMEYSYSTKPKESNNNAAHMGSFPSFMENKVCRKPELILEMLKRKR